MGVTSKIHCHKCGERFERDYGIGVLGKGTLYCDRCGKPMNVDLSLGWMVDMECECGGTHKAEALGCCPKCGVKLVVEDVVDRAEADKED